MRNIWKIRLQSNKVEASIRIKRNLIAFILYLFLWSFIISLSIIYTYIKSPHGYNKFLIPFFVQSSLASVIAFTSIIIHGYRFKLAFASALLITTLLVPYLIFSYNIPNDDNYLICVVGGLILIATPLSIVFMLILFFNRSLLNITDKKIS